MSQAEKHPPPNKRIKIEILETEEQRAEEAEIVAMVTKMRKTQEEKEARRALLPSSYPAPKPTVNENMVRKGQPSILAFFQRVVKKPIAVGEVKEPAPPPPPKIDDENAIDFLSKKGQFGWHNFPSFRKFNLEAVPYIFRQVIEVSVFQLIC
jgi:hypothetical protein